MSYLTCRRNTIDSNTNGWPCRKEPPIMEVEKEDETPRYVLYCFSAE